MTPLPSSARNLTHAAERDIEGAGVSPRLSTARPKRGRAGEAASRSSHAVAAQIDVDSAFIGDALQVLASLIGEIPEPSLRRCP